MWLLLIERITLDLDFIVLMVVRERCYSQFVGVTKTNRHMTKEWPTKRLAFEQWMIEESDIQNTILKVRLLQ